MTFKILNIEANLLSEVFPRKNVSEKKELVLGDIYFAKYMK